MSLIYVHKYDESQCVMKIDRGVIEIASKALDIGTKTSLTTQIWKNLIKLTLN